MKTKKIIIIVLMLMLAVSLTACGGDDLRGKWAGTDEDGAATWEFDGQGICFLTTYFLDEEKGTYTVKEDGIVDIQLNIWDEPLIYKYVVDGEELTLTPTDANPYAPSYKLEKKK